MAPKAPKHITFYLLALTILFFLISCANEEKNQEDPVNTDQSESQISQGSLPPGIPSFPYIFSGTISINGEKISQNIQIKAMLGELDSPTILSSNSEFNNLIIGPRNNDDIKNNIEFYLLLENGDILKAKEEIPFDVVKKITNQKIDLNFEN